MSRAKLANLQMTEPQLFQHNTGVVEAADFAVHAAYADSPKQALEAGQMHTESGRRHTCRTAEWFVQCLT